MIFLLSAGAAVHHPRPPPRSLRMLQTYLGSTATRALASRQPAPGQGEETMKTPRVRVCPLNPDNWEYDEIPEQSFTSKTISDLPNRAILRVNAMTYFPVELQ